MNLFTVRGFASKSFHGVMAILFITLLSAGNAVFGQQPEQPAAAPAAAPAAEAPAPKIPNDQLDSLVAPIALYPDPLLALTLAASTYPLEVIQLEQWMKKNPTLKGKPLADAVAKQSWDPSVQSMAAYPEVIKQLAENVAWSSDLGNAFLAQQADVMDAVQRMRAKAEGKGALKTSSQQKVETKTVESKQVIVIQPADPEVIYVPQYSPTVVYGAPMYPYPYYPPPYYGALAFGAGIAIGAAWGGNWGNCNWDNHGDVEINHNNNFNKNTNINGGNRNQINNRPANAGGGKWQHNPQHRGGAPYGDRGTASKYGGRARQQPAGGAGASTRPGGGTGNMGAGTRPGGGAGAGNRPGGGAGAATRPGGGAGASTRPAGGASDLAKRDQAGSARQSTGGDRIGNQSLGGGGSSNFNARTGTGGGGGGSRDFGGSSPSFSSSSSRGGGFGGGGGGSSARASSSRGGSSMGGGGFSGGGGRGGGGGGRGGGGGGGRRR